MMRHIHTKYLLVFIEKSERIHTNHLMTTIIIRLGGGNCVETTLLLRSWEHNNILVCVRHLPAHDNSN